MSKTPFRRIPPLGLLAALVAAAAPAPAALADGAPRSPAAQTAVLPAHSPVVHRAGAALSVEAGAGRVVQLPRPVATVFAADPRVAEVRPASPTALFVFGVAPGRTTVAALDAEGNAISQHEVTVRPSSFAANEAQGSIARALPGRAVRVEVRPNGLALFGEVRSAAEAEQAVAIARGHLAEGQVVDSRLAVGGQVQVNLRVRIAEVSREVTRQLGVDWQAIGANGFVAGGVLTRAALPDFVNPSAGRALLNWTGGNFDVNAALDLLAQNRLVNILAEPNLTAKSGETASFLAGGEFPIPVALRDGVVTIQFKQYGVGLAFVPTVLSDGRISLRVRPEVSELTEAGAVRLAAGNNSIQIPALAVRRAETTVELGSGQSFAIGGLLQDSARGTVRAIPGAGEIPVLGALFRSDRFQRAETELVIVITPYIVRPQSDPAALRLPNDQAVPAGEFDRLALGRQLARPPAPPRAAPARAPGEAGFAMPRFGEAAP